MGKYFKVYLCERSERKILRCTSASEASGKKIEGVPPRAGKYFKVYLRERREREIFKVYFRERSERGKN